ncbi:hypothetical protein [Herbaspirillum autotrophicum]|uniref:hypothetical protein n=1 Tax=Herbaspirillum autotrophicum TaxID=180195 RepID=UPI0012EE3551|nr:hypothetical protein [Herbaspirillum autotrophicum]
MTARAVLQECVPVRQPVTDIRPTLAKSYHFWNTNKAVLLPYIVEKEFIRPVPDWRRIVAMTPPYAIQDAARYAARRGIAARRGR